MTAFILALLRLLRALRRGLQDDDFRVLLTSATLLLLLGTVFYHLEEGWSVLDSVFFSLITLTTVRWEPSNTFVGALTWSHGFKGALASGVEIGIMVFTPRFLCFKGCVPD